METITMEQAARVWQRVRGIAPEAQFTQWISQGMGRRASFCLLGGRRQTAHLFRALIALEEESLERLAGLRLLLCGAGERAFPAACWQGNFADGLRHCYESCGEARVDFLRAAEDRPEEAAAFRALAALAARQRQLLAQAAKSVANGSFHR